MPGDDTSYSTTGLTDRDLGAALDVIAEAGFTQVELTSHDPHMVGSPEGPGAAELVSLVESRGLRARTVHAPSGRTTLGAPEEDWRKREVATLAKYARFTADIGATDMIVHPVPNPIFVPDADSPETPGLIQNAVSRSLDELVPVAEKVGIRINLENLPYHCSYPYLKMRELRPLVEPYAAECLGLVLDSGHVGVLDNDCVVEVRAAGERLRGTHLHDVVGHEDGTDHRAPLRGFIDWRALLQALEDIDYPGPYTFEVIVPNEGESREELARVTRQFAVAWGLTD